MIEKKMVRHVLQNRASNLVIGYLSFSLPIVFNEGGGIFDHGNSEKAILSLSEIMNYTFPLLLNIY